MTETIIYTTLLIGGIVCCLGIVLSALAVYKTKKREEELQRRTHYVDCWRHLEAAVAYPMPIDVALLREKQYVEVILTVIKSKRQMLILKNSSKDMFLGKARDKCLYLDIDTSYKEPLLIYVKDCDRKFYKLDLPVGYTGAVSIPDDFDIDYVIECAKNCPSFYVRYQENCERILLNG